MEQDLVKKAESKQDDNMDDMQNEVVVDVGKT